MRNAFLQNAEDIAGETAVERLCALFKGVSLPVPEENEYFTTRDGGLLIPITRYGVTIRLTNSVHLQADDCGHMLQPLARERLGKLDFRINPGLRLGVSAEDYSRALSACEQEGYVDEDAAAFNAGYLPCVSSTYPDGIPVFFDPDVLSDFYKHVQMVKAMIAADGEKLPTAEAAAAQDSAFKDLRSAFQVLRGNEINAEKFWTLCREAKAQGLLHSPWEAFEGAKDASSSDIKVAQVARRYEARLN